MPFKIWNDGDAGHLTRIEIDGEDVSRHFRTLCITAGARTAVEIQLEPIVEEVPVGRFKGPNDNGPTRLVFGTAETQALLIKHGWTPPKGD